MDFWCDTIASYTSSWTGLLAPSFLHSFLKDVLELFCEHEPPIIFSPGVAVDGVSTIFAPIFVQYVTGIKKFIYGVVK